MTTRGVIGRLVRKTLDKFTILDSKINFASSEVIVCQEYFQNKNRKKDHQNIKLDDLDLNCRDCDVDTGKHVAEEFMTNPFIRNLIEKLMEYINVLYNYGLGSDEYNIIKRVLIRNIIQDPKYQNVNFPITWTYHQYSDFIVNNFEKEFGDKIKDKDLSIYPYQHFKKYEHAFINTLEIGGNCLEGKCDVRKFDLIGVYYSQKCKKYEIGTFEYKDKLCIGSSEMPQVNIYVPIVLSIGQYVGDSKEVCRDFIDLIESGKV